MMDIFTSFHKLRFVDILIIVFIHILSLISILFLFGSQESILLIIINLVIGIFIILLSRISNTTHSNFLNGIYDWYPVPMIYFIFKEVHVIIQSQARNDWDNILVGIDRAMLGTDPTVWLTKFSSPLVTEILQIAYASYYFIMIAVGIELYLRKEQQKFSFSVFLIVYGFILSYIGYLTLPAVGPRFTLHDFYSMDSTLPGLWLTNTIRDLINAGESISKNAVNAYAIAQRDAFPSGHTQMTLLSMYLSHSYKLKVRYLIYIFGTLLIISTVYLRYHYVIDVLGGVVFMGLTLWSGPKLLRWWEKIQINKNSSIPPAASPKRPVY